MGEACHETLVHGIADDGKDHRDRASGSLQFGNDWGTVGEDQIWRRSHQLPDVSADQVGIASCKPIVDVDIVPVDPTKLFESMPKGRDARLAFWIMLGGRSQQNPDPSNAFALLRESSERP